MRFLHPLGIKRFIELLRLRNYVPTNEGRTRNTTTGWQNGARKSAASVPYRHEVECDERSV